MSPTPRWCNLLRKNLESGSSGIGLIVVPPRAALDVTGELGLPSATGAAILSEAAIASGERLVVCKGLPPHRSQAITALVELNGSRNLIASRGKLLVVVLDRTEVALLMQFAPDVYSALLFVETVPFVPDSDVDHHAARAGLEDYYRRKFGRLDLRGFIRSESEDVSWRIEDIYQELEASEVAFVNGKIRTLTPVAAPLSDTVAALLAKRRPRERAPASLVVMGHPGSGKTFFLRWLALRCVSEPEVFGVAEPLPLIASLAAYAQTPGPISLLDYMVEALLEAEQEAAHVVHSAAQSGRAVFLLDGLDEVGDDAARRRVLDSVEQLRGVVGSCPVVVTTRIAGYTPLGFPAAHLMLSPFSDRAIRSFLAKWCELYAMDRHGTAAASTMGRQEGYALGRDVLEHPQVQELARNPLMLTVLAIVHRAGVRLPDHRVELYDHATKILVERWNRIRSPFGVTAGTPLKAADAVRLLGPIALESVRAGLRGAIPESDLRRMLERAISGGHLRGLHSVDQAIDIFKNSLGLLVEQAPGIFSFLHLTLAEYFAARELLRSDELEKLLSNPRVVYYAEWREIVLLAAGELGVMRAEDTRLKNAVSLLLDSASRRQGRPSPTVPSLLGGLVADDPNLTHADGERITRALVPTWWFGRAYGKQALAFAMWEASRTIQDRIARGRFAGALRDRFETVYGRTVPPDVAANLSRAGSWVRGSFFLLLGYGGIDYGPALLNWMYNSEQRAWGVLASIRLRGVPVWGRPPMVECRFEVSAYLDELVRAQELPMSLRLRFSWSSVSHQMEYFTTVVDWTASSVAKRDGPLVTIACTTEIGDRIPSGASVSVSAVMTRRSVATSSAVP